MSADSQGDSGNLNKEEKSPAATQCKGISVTSTVDENVILSHINTDQNTLLTPASKAVIPLKDDKEGEDEEIENIIEKKLPIAQDKGLDVDSELDFELKWDDDTDLNEDLIDTGNEIESALTSVDEGIANVSKNAETVSTSIEEPLYSEKDTESILTSIDEGLDSVTKDLETTTTSNVKDLDNEEKAMETILTSIDEALDGISKETETTLTSIDKVIDNSNEMQSTLTSTEKGLSSVGQDIENISSTEKDLGSAGPKTEVDIPFVEKDNDLDDLDCKMDDNVEINTAPDTNVMDIDEVAEVTQSKPVGILMHSDELKETNVSKNEGETLNVVTGRIDFATKSSPNESETNSLDEQLVYSDVEVPDIEDIDLLDEMDTQITETNKHIDELKIKDTEKIQALPEPSTSQEEYKESGTSQKDLDEIDAQITETNKCIDELEIKDTEKIQALPKPSTSQEECRENETSQKDLSELDVGSNLINSTQVTEKSDLSDTCASVTNMETSSYDINNEHGLDKPDVMLDIPTQELIESFDDSGETFDTAGKGKHKLVKSENAITKPDLIESTTSEKVNKMMPEFQATIDKSNLVQSDINDDSKSASDIFLKDKVESVVEREKSTDNMAKIESMDVDSSATSEEEIKTFDENPEGNTNIEAIKPILEARHASTEEKLSEGDIILEANSEQLKLDADETIPAKETEVNQEIEEKSFASEDIKDVESKSKDIDVAQPSTSKDHQELYDEDHDRSKAKDVDVAPSTSNDHQELSDEDQKASKPKDIDAAPSTSKDHQELSDEDQEATDSLGLLAESSRIMDDEDEQENEAEDDDDDDDFDQDDESNQMMTEHSEDSNAQHSESDGPKEPVDVDESNDAAAPLIDEIAEIQDMETETDDHEVYDVDSHQDESSADKGNFQIQIDGVVSGVPEVETEAEESVEASAETPEGIEAQKAVEVLLVDKPAEEESNDVPEPAASVEEAAKQPKDADLTALQNSRLRALLLKDSSDSSNDTSEAEQKSPTRSNNVEISKPKHEINIVELEESSSEDDVQVCKPEEPEPTTTPKEVTPATVEQSLQKKDVVNDVPTPTRKPAKLDTEKTKTASPDTESTAIPETTAPKTPEAKAPVHLGEIFSLDSDDEDTGDKNKSKKKLTAVEVDKAGETNKCINVLCFSDVSVPLVPASISASVYYAANPQRGSGLCLNCAQRYEDRSKKLIEGVKDLTPYLDMEMCMVREELVEISDSDSDEDTVVKKDDEILGEKGVKFLEEQLAAMFNDTWKKYDMEARLMTAQTEISREIGQLEEECKKIDAMLHDCQTDTDKLRNDLYGTFADDRRTLPSISIFDTPTNQWSGLEESLPLPVEKEPRQAKRRLPAPPEPTAKRPAIPLGYAPLDANKEPDAKPAQPPAEVPLPPEDDNADISVVKLSVESAPAGLPPPGVATRLPLKPNMLVYAMRNSFGAWHKVRIVEVQPKVANQFTMCRVKFELPKNTSKLLPARCLAYEHAPDVRLTIGTRVVALFKDHRNLEVLEKKEAYYSGIVAEIPNPVNNFRYLIFFDDGYAQYVQHAVTRLVCECAPRVWDEVHPFSRQFVRDYLRAYPERPMVRLHAGQSIKTEWNGRWWPSKVLQVDASLVHVSFDGKKEAGIDKTEWIYRGSTRLAPLFLELQAAERQRSRPLPRAQAGRRFNMPYVEYTRPDDPTDSSKPTPPPSPVKTLTPAQNLAQTQAQIEQEIRRQRAVAKKSTAVAPLPQPVRENVTSRVVYYSPKNAIKPHKWVQHTCGPQCKRKDVLALKDLRTYNPLTKPLLSGWERHTLRFRAPQSKTAMYRAPCGRRIRNHRELHQYLQAVDSDMSVDLFDFNPHTHCLAEFVLNKCIVSKKDLSHGKENVPVPCVNYYDDSLPEFCSYNTERTPTAGVPLNLDPEFLCGCDCTDDCADKTKCACWKMTLEGARTIGLDTDEVGYVYKRLPEPLPSGIYECNSRCKCRQTCLNRVAQHPLQLKLQVFKTANRGWGIRALNDVPKGAFLCVYAGNLLTDATANLDGLNEGDEYLAELDYIEVVEQMKEGFEEDIPDDAKKLDQDSSSSSSLSSDEEPARDQDDDFRPALPTGQYRGNAYSKRLRKREKCKKSKENEEKEKKAKEYKEKNSEDCITISDDEELREPARFAARAGMGGKEFVSKYKSVRAHFGKDEACYIMDAKVQGNIGRYLNHSCTPNVFVQNVFVDTHDPRFPWVAFFALSHIKAGTELTWNYNYDVGSVPGKVLYCYCNAPNCRGRLL